MKEGYERNAKSTNYPWTKIIIFCITNDMISTSFVNYMNSTRAVVQEGIKKEKITLSEKVNSNKLLLLASI